MSKRCVNLIKRQKLMKRIQMRIQQSNQLGGYRYVGEWGSRIKQQHYQQTKRYNNLRFFWQSPLRVEPGYSRGSLLHGILLILLGILMFTLIDVYG